MFVALRSITMPSGDVASWVAALRAAAAGLPAMAESWVAETTPGATINAGQIVWRMTFLTEASALAVSRSAHWATQIAPLLADASVEQIGYRITRRGGAPTSGGIWRALVFRVVPHAPPEQVKALEAGLLLFPKYIASIRSWALSNVSYNEGPKAFTHVWEQQFEAIEGLTGPYMDDPLHWGLVDAFFDAEYPEYIVDPQLFQIVGDVDRTTMA